MPGKNRQGVPWLAARREFSASRNGLLTLSSFLIPLGLWCLVSYCPFIWHPDVRLDIAANRESSNSVFVPGDHVGRKFIAGFQEEIRTQNQAILAARTAAEEPSGTESARRRANKKILRQISGVALRNGWINHEQADDDRLIYEVWADLATQRKTATSPPLSEENLAIVASNWALMAAYSPTYDSNNFPDEPFLQLIPAGVPSNPDYLPPPHIVVSQGIREFTREREPGSLTMTDRLFHSIRIVFGGFLVACLIGIPLGVLCGTYALFSRLVEPFVDFFRYMPAPTFSTLLVALFLANDAPKIALVVIGTVFQMVLVIAKTTRLLDVSLLEAAQTLGARQGQLLTRVVVPGIMPMLYNDLRILLGWAWTWLVIAELIGVKSGLTEFIETQGRWRNFDRVYPIIILIGLVGFFTDQILALLHPIFFPWTAQRRKPGWLTRILTFVPRALHEASQERIRSMESLSTTTSSARRPLP